MIYLMDSAFHCLNNWHLVCILFCLTSGLWYSILQLYLGKEKKYYKTSVTSKVQSWWSTASRLSDVSLKCILLRNPDLDIQNLKYHTRLPPVVNMVTLCFHCCLPQANILLNPSKEKNVVLKKGDLLFM